MEDTLLTFLKSQMDTAKFEYQINFDNQYDSNYESQIISGEIKDLPDNDEKIVPKYINVNKYYTPESTEYISGTWSNLNNINNYRVEIYILTDKYYLVDSCELKPDGSWISTKEIKEGFKVIKLVDNTQTGDDNRFIEYPYSQFSNFKFRLYSLTDTEYLTDEVPIFDVGNGKYIFYTNKARQGLKVGKVLNRIWRANAYQYDIVGISGAVTNIGNGRLPSSYLIPTNDPSYDKDGSSAKGKYGYMLNSRSWIYDVGLVLLVFTTSGDYDLCKEIMDRIKYEQNPNGSFNFSYDNYIGPLFEGYVRTGSVGWLVWGMTYYTITTGDKAYLRTIKTAGEWLLSKIITDESDDRYGLLTGGYGSYDDNYEYQPTEIEWCSTEHQVSSLQALNGLFKLTGDVRYKNAANNVHYRLLKRLYDKKSYRFYQGMTKNGVDNAWALDCVTWAGLSTLTDSNFNKFARNIINVTQSEYGVNDTILTSDVENRFNTTYSSDENFSGFKPYSDRDNGYSGSPSIVWSEGTLGFALLCIRNNESGLANKYLSEMKKLQNVANTSGGLLYSTATYAELPWEFHVWECVTSTSWLYLLNNNTDVLFTKNDYPTVDIDKVTPEEALKDIWPNCQYELESEFTIFDNLGIEITGKITDSYKNSDDNSIFTIKNGKFDEASLKEYLNGLGLDNSSVVDIVFDKLGKAEFTSEIEHGQFSIKVTIGADSIEAIEMAWTVFETKSGILTESLTISFEGKINFPDVPGAAEIEKIVEDIRLGLICVGLVVVVISAAVASGVFDAIAAAIMAFIAEIGMVLA